MLAFLIKTFGNTLIGELLRSFERAFRDWRADQARQELGRVKQANETTAASIKQKQAVEAKAAVEPDREAVIAKLDKGEF